jgi:hypothetical protein
LFLCGVGVLTAIIAIVLGIVALSKGAGRGQAIAAIVTSVIALAIAAALAVWLSNIVSECSALPPKLSEACIESKLPWGGGPR